MGPLTTLDPAGPTAAPIATLWWAMLGGATALLLLVMALLWLAYRKPGYAARTATRTWLFGGGVILPAILLITLASYAFHLGEQLLPHAAPRVMEVRAIATMWMWQFGYPHTNDAALRAELHIPAGEPVDVIVTSSDVIHSFWIPRLAGKIDAIPGRETRVRIRAEAPGEYEGQCAEFCGLGHAHMRFKVIVHAADDYAAALGRIGQ
jgi:cytochrome c oxidase subunit 2